MRGNLLGGRFEAVHDAAVQNELKIIAKPAHVCLWFKKDPERQPFCIRVKSKLESSCGKT